MLHGKTSDGPRWPRGQKFTVSEAGTTADEAYRAAVQEARGVGRGALDAALAAWAAPLGVAAGDGVLLAELRAKPRGLADLARSLEDAGASPTEIRAAVDRLVKAGLVEPVPLPSRAAEPPAPPPVRRW
ncbi:MAG: hypothetical protein QM767_03545 [Anaeromyxobacter sp.]